MKPSFLKKCENESVGVSSKEKEKVSQTKISDCVRRRTFCNGKIFLRKLKNIIADLLPPPNLFPVNRVMIDIFPRIYNSEKKPIYPLM